MSRKGSFFYPLPSHAVQSADWHGWSKMSILIAYLHLKIFLSKPNSELPLWNVFQKVYHTAIVVPLFKMWSRYVRHTLYPSRKCCLASRYTKISKQTKITPHHHQNHVEDHSVLQHDVRESIYVQSSSRTWIGWSIMPLILRDWWYLIFCPLNQGLLLLRAKNCPEVGNNSQTSCSVFCCVLVNMSLVFLSYH